MSTGRIRIHYVIMGMRNLEYMSRGDSYNDISYAEMFPMYALAKESAQWRYKSYLRMQAADYSVAETAETE